MGNIASLGGLMPVINQGLATYRSADRLAGNTSRGDRLQLDQAREHNRLAEALAGEKALQDQALLSAEAADTERRRQTALKRAVARQRAAYGGAGVDGEGGSSEAVLLGLFNESEQERAAADNIYKLREKILTDNVQNLRRRNLLEESQLATRLRRRGV